MFINKSVIAAIKTDEQLKKACDSSVALIFDMSPSINSISERNKLCKSSGKQLLVHMDLIEGVGKDKAGLEFIQKCGINGIISTRASIIKSAKEINLKTIQRIFIIDSQSIKSATSVLKTGPDILEIMPGIVPRAITAFKNALSIPIIAGGLIETPDDIKSAFDAGAVAVSTGMEKLWNYR